MKKNIFVVFVNDEVCESKGYTKTVMLGDATDKERVRGWWTCNPEKAVKCDAMVVVNTPTNEIASAWDFVPELNRSEDDEAPAANYVLFEEKRFVGPSGRHFSKCKFAIEPSTNPVANSLIGRSFHKKFGQACSSAYCTFDEDTDTLSYTKTGEIIL